MRGFAWSQEIGSSDQETNKNIVIEPIPYGIPVIEEFLSEVVTEPEEIKPVLQPHITRIEAVQELTISEYTSESDNSYINHYDVEKSEITKKAKGEVFNKEPSETINPIISTEHHNGTDEDRIEIITKDTPVPKQRPRYIKLQSTHSSTVLKTSNPTNIRRHKSESDLLDDSFDAPPRVLSRKKDNTLISKIYSQPHVRNFALSSRKQIPVDDAPTSPSPILMTQRSLNEATIRYNGKTPLYYSDDGMSLPQNGKKSLYSSEEDLLESTSSKDGSLQINGRRYETKSKTISISSEDDVFSEHSSIAGHSVKRSNSKTHLYSSSEDLLSIEEHERPHKKKDNTLIEKIYQDKNVRDFALSNRDYITLSEEYLSSKKKTEDDVPDSIHYISASEQAIIPQTPIILNEDTVKKITKPEETIVISSSVHHQEEYERNLTPDPEINELAKKKIVHNILEQYSVHKPEVVQTIKIKREPKEINNNHEADEEIATTSVKELRKKFENSDVSY